MIIWVDAQLSAIAEFIRLNFSVDAVPIRELGLRDANDAVIFEEARKRSAVVMTKESDFYDLVLHLGVPPKILWITCGNTSNEVLQKILSVTLPKALKILESDEIIVEISGNS